PVEIATPLENASILAGHLWFYLVRLLWFPAPWSLALVVAAWGAKGRVIARWRALAPSLQRGLLFALGLSVLAVALLSPSSRFAERYAFSAAFLVGAAGSVAALDEWPSLRAWFERWDRAIAAFPVVVWTALMLARVVLGPYLPRISWD